MAQLNHIRPGALRRPVTLREPAVPILPDAVVPQAASSAPLDVGEQSSAAVRKPHAPNRKQHDLDLKDIADQIAAKEREISLRKQQYNAEIVVNQRKKLNDETQEANRQLNLASEALKTRNEEIQKKHDEINKLRPRMTYRSEVQIDQTINRLEHQRTNTHFSLPEEQKIIREIDKLRRSKNELRAYNNLENEKRRLDGSLKELRDARQARYMGIQRLITEDRGLKEAERLYKDGLDVLIRDIQVLNLRRRQVIQDYEYAVSAWDAHMAQTRRLKYLQDQQARTSFRNDGAMIEPVVKDPYAGAKQVVSSLLTYLQQYVKAEESLPGGSASLPCTPTASVPSQPSSASPSLEQVGSIPGFFLPRKMSVGLPVRGLTRLKKDKRKNKSIAHSAAVVQQFGSLDLIPPANVGEIQSTIEELKAKKLELERKTVAKFASLTPKHSPEEEKPPLSLPATESALPDEICQSSKEPLGDTVDSKARADVVVSRQTVDEGEKGLVVQEESLAGEMTSLSVKDYEVQVPSSRSSTVGSIVSEEDASNMSMSEATAENSTDEDSASDNTTRRFSSLIVTQSSVGDGFDRGDGQQTQDSSDFCPAQKFGLSEPETPEIDETFCKPRFAVAESTGECGDPK